ncbi:UNVERIFIED_CONTAM: hypothetical protein K2H54_037259 [Gekko kuhli]
MRTKPFHDPQNKVPSGQERLCQLDRCFPSLIIQCAQAGERTNETTIKLDTQIWPLHIHLGLEAPAASEGEGWDWEGRLLPPHSHKSPGLRGEGLAHNRGSLHGQHCDGSRRWGRDGCREGADLTRTCGGRKTHKVKWLVTLRTHYIS